MSGLTSNDIDSAPTTAEGLCEVVEKLGYRAWVSQLQCKNGAFVSSLLAFFNDNPGAVEVLYDFIRDNHPVKEEGVDDSEDDNSAPEPA